MKNVIELLRTRQELRDTQKALAYQQELVRKAEMMLRTMLWPNLSKQTQAWILNFMRFYHPEARLELYYAMLDYVISGKLKRFSKPVAGWHFRLFCKKVDADQNDGEVHRHMMVQMKRLGFFEPMPKEEQEPDFRPFDQEW